MDWLRRRKKESNISQRNINTTIQEREAPATEEVVINICDDDEGGAATKQSHKTSVSIKSWHQRKKAHKLKTKRSRRIIRVRSMEQTHVQDKGKNTFGQQQKFEKREAWRQRQIRKLELKRAQGKTSFYRLKLKARVILHDIESRGRLSHVRDPETGDLKRKSLPLPKKLKTAREKVKHEIQIPIALMRLEDPATAIPWVKSLSNKVEEWDDWSWFRERSPLRSAALAQRAQLRNEVLAQPSVRALNEHEREALAAVALGEYDPEENRQEIRQKLLSERRTYHDIRARESQATIERPKLQQHFTNLKRLRSTMINLTTGQCLDHKDDASEPSSEEMFDFEDEKPDLPQDLKATASPSREQAEQTETASIEQSPVPGPSGVERSRVLQCRESEYYAKRSSESHSSASVHCSKGSNGNGGDSSIPPDEPYSQVFVIESEEAIKPSIGKVVTEKDFPTIRPFGEREPVLVYRAEMDKFVQTQMRATYATLKIPPPCLCRPGFPLEGVCRSMAVSTPTLKIGYTEFFAFLGTFLLRMMFYWGLTVALTFMFLRSKGFTNFRPRPVKLQDVWNTYLDFDGESKLYIFNNTLEANRRMMIRILGPWSQQRTGQPCLNWQFERMYMYKNDFNRYNVSIENIFVERYSAEVPHKTGTYRYDNTTMCPASKFIIKGIKSYIRKEKSDERIGYSILLSYKNVTSIWYDFLFESVHGVDDPWKHWAGFMLNWFLNWVLPATRLIWRSQNVTSLNIREYALLVNNSTRRWGHHVEWISYAHIAGLKMSYWDTTCYYSYSRMEIATIPHRMVEIDWKNINFCPWGDLQPNEHVTMLQGAFDSWRRVQANSIKNHRVYANESEDYQDNTEVIYAFEYMANVKEDTDQQYLDKTLAFGVHILDGHDDDWTTSTTESRPLVVSDPNKNKYMVGFLIFALPLLILLQVDRATAVLVTAIFALSAISFLYLKPDWYILLEYFDIGLIVPYAFIMLVNATLADTGVYDVFAKGVVQMTMRSFTILFPALWAATILATIIFSAVGAMLLLTPLAVRMMEETSLNPRPLLISMILMANIASLFSADATPYNQMLLKGFHPYVREVIEINETPFYMQHLTSAFLCFAITGGYFTFIFWFWKPQRYGSKNKQHKKIILHEMELWRRVDGALPPGTAQIPYLSRVVTGERHKLQVDWASGGQPVFVSKDYDDVHNIGLLFKLTVLVFITAGIMLFRHWNKMGFGCYGLLGAVLISVLPILLINRHTSTVQNLICRFDLTTLIMTAAFIFIGGVLVELKAQEIVCNQLFTSFPPRDDWRAIIATSTKKMLTFSSSVTAVLGVGANKPVIATMDFVINKFKNYATSRGIARHSYRAMAWATTVGVNIGGSATILGSATAYATSVTATQQGYHLGALSYMMYALPVTLVNMIANYIYWTKLFPFMDKVPKKRRERPTTLWPKSRTPWIIASPTINASLTTSRTTKAKTQRTKKGLIKRRPTTTTTTEAQNR